MLSVAGSALLAAQNIIVGLLAGSTSVVATGVEFVGDVFASLVVFFGMLIAAKPADEDHPYGHGRIEILAGLVVGLTIAAGGAGICYRSMQNVDAIHSPPSPYGIWPLVVSMLVKGGMSISKFRVGRRIESTSLVADAWNDAVDILSAGAAMTALTLTLYRPDRFLAADHYGGFAVGVIVILTGIRVARDTSLDLMDTMPGAGFIAQIRQASLLTPGVLAVEKCYGRKTGLQYHLDLHIQVDPRMTVADSHEVASAVRAALCEKFPSVADVLVHVEPYQESSSSGA